MSDIDGLVVDTLKTALVTPTGGAQDTLANHLGLLAPKASPTFTSTITYDRLISSAATTLTDPTGIDWTGTKDSITATFSAGQTITITNAPTAHAKKTMVCSAASGGPHALGWVGATVIPSGDTIIVPASGSLVVTLETLAGTTFVSARGDITDIYGLLTALNARVVSGGALGTPSSGTLTNCTGLPAAGLVASTSTAVGFGSIELGHASDTTLARSAAGVATIEGVRIATLVGVNSVNATGNLVNNTINEFYGSTAAQTLTLPAMANGDSLIVDNTSSVSVTIGRNSQTINGAASDDTLTSGKAVTYYWRASGALRRIGALS